MAARTTRSRRARWLLVSVSGTTGSEAVAESAMGRVPGEGSWGAESHPSRARSRTDSSFRRPSQGGAELVVLVVGIGRLAGDEGDLGALLDRRPDLGVGPHHLAVGRALHAADLEAG